MINQDRKVIGSRCLTELSRNSLYVVGSSVWFRHKRGKLARMDLVYTSSSLAWGKRRLFV